MYIEDFDEVEMERLGAMTRPFLGRKIVAAGMDREYDGKVMLCLDDGGFIVVYDKSSACCGTRYITTDDDIQSLVGGVLTRIECKPGASMVEGGECHETMFVEIGTDKGFVTLTTHNKHNGYYSGFDLEIRGLDASGRAPRDSGRMRA